MQSLSIFFASAISQTCPTPPGTTTKALFKLARTPKTMLQLDVEEIAAAIKPCGLYNVKAKNIRRLRSR